MAREQEVDDVDGSANCQEENDVDASANCGSGGHWGDWDATVELVWRRGEDICSWGEIVVVFIDGREIWYVAMHFLI